MLWIAALCINQEDYDERARQVLLMPRIYHSALSVWLWLGEADEYTESALNLLALLAERGQNVRFDPSQLPASSVLRDAISLKRLVLPVFPGPQWEALVRLFDRPVLRRLWVVQEIVTARKTIVQCGEMQLDFEAVLLGVHFVSQSSWEAILSASYERGEASMSFIRIIGGLRIDWLTRKRNLRWKLIRDTRRFQASDPRDKVYALFSLFNDFAHREGHDLGACGNSEHNITIDDLRDRGFQIETDEDDRSGLGALSSALEDVINASGRDKREAEDSEAIEILCESDGETMRGIHENMVNFMRNTLGFLSHELTRLTGKEISSIANHEYDWESDAGHALFRKDTDTFIANFSVPLHSGRNSISPDMQVVKKFVLNFLQDFSLRNDRLQYLLVSDDAEEEAVAETASLTSFLCDKLRALDPDLVEEEDDSSATEDWSSDETEVEATVATAAEAGISTENLAKPGSISSQANNEPVDLLHGGDLARNDKVEQDHARQRDLTGTSFGEPGSISSSPRCTCSFLCEATSPECCLSFHA